MECTWYKDHAISEHMVAYENYQEIYDFLALVMATIEKRGLSRLTSNDIYYLVYCKCMLEDAVEQTSEDYVTSGCLSRNLDNVDNLLKLIPNVSLKKALHKKTNLIDTFRLERALLIGNREKKSFSDKMETYNVFLPGAFAIVYLVLGFPIRTGTYFAVGTIVVSLILGLLSVFEEKRPLLLFNNRLRNSEYILDNMYKHCLRCVCCTCNKEDGPYYHCSRFMMCVDGIAHDLRCLEKKTEQQYYDYRDSIRKIKAASRYVDTTIKDVENVVRYERSILRGWNYRV